MGRNFLRTTGHDWNRRESVVLPVLIFLFNFYQQAWLFRVMEILIYHLSELSNLDGREACVFPLERCVFSHLGVAISPLAWWIEVMICLSHLGTIRSISLSLSVVQIDMYASRIKWASAGSPWPQLGPNVSTEYIKKNPKTIASNSSQDSEVWLRAKIDVGLRKKFAIVPNQG